MQLNDLQKYKSQFNYIGIKEASTYLRMQGVDRYFRKQILESFERQSIIIRYAGPSEFGIRFYDNINAKALGRYVFTTFASTTRNRLAIKIQWNKMTQLKQWQIKEGAVIIQGAAARQGIGLEGMKSQIYVNELENLIFSHQSIV